MQISWITFGYPERRPDGSLTSAVASLRYRVLSPISGMRGSGYQHAIIPITPQTAPLPWDAALRSDLLVFSKSFTPSNEELATKAKALGIPVLFDVCDNHYDHPHYGSHYRAMSALADRVICNSPAMAKVALPYCSRPPVVIEDPHEGPRGEPRYSPGERLKLLWFGHPSNLDSLQASLSDLSRWSKRRPISLVVLTELNPAIDAAFARISAESGPAFRISGLQWSLAAQWRELATCDAVIIPSIDNSRKAVKSANRMIESLWAGRPAVAQPLAAYLPFAAWTPVYPTLAEGLDWLQENQGDCPGLISSAQAYIEASHAPALLAQEWEQVIRATQSQDVAAR